MTETPKLLSRGQLSIVNGEGDAAVQAYIAVMPGWRADVCRRLDRIVTRTAPDLRKAVKWDAPIYGRAGGRSWFLSITGYENLVRVAFFDGAVLRPPPLGTTKIRDVRYYDIREGGLDEAQFAGWVEQAAVLPGWAP
jgi:hypothetical protein